MPKRASITFVPCSKRNEIGLRFGGEPYGLPESQWPVSRSSGKPMQFIAQIPFGPDLFPGVAESVAYLFMSVMGEQGEEETWSADSGENAVVILPRNRITQSLTQEKAPGLHQMVKKWWKQKLVPEACCFSTQLEWMEDPDFIAEHELREMTDEQAEAYLEVLNGTKLGGTPRFIQADELPLPEPWHLLLQLDSAQVPFFINFGDAGVGYAFINGSGTEGRFLWQCG